VKINLRIRTCFYQINRTIAFGYNILNWHCYTYPIIDGLKEKRRMPHVVKLNMMTIIGMPLKTLPITTPSLLCVENVLVNPGALVWMTPWHINFASTYRSILRTCHSDLMEYQRMQMHIRLLSIAVENKL